MHTEEIAFVGVFSSDFRKWHYVLVGLTKVMKMN